MTVTRVGAPALRDRLSGLRVEDLQPVLFWVTSCQPRYSGSRAIISPTKAVRV